MGNRKNLTFSDKNHFQYFAHVLNLAVQAGLKHLKEEIEQIRNIILKYRSSSQWQQKFSKILMLNNINLVSNLDVPTCWNFIFYII
ncbi:zinc finger bed domain-containing protein ricesleeper 2-like [Gigaspora margarita]|uniref:Zinc finger bed domain-containing protein ricesleeper 2-like n=1 Tax=Gigaspora margarita TaxID=4874 RepID=A0A8H4B1P7_GIGMA|nr:zinc finger bed domain-containing protein ricesleeper 2-like [Gigaspora margarita]